MESAATWGLHRLKTRFLRIFAQTSLGLLSLGQHIGTGKLFHSKGTARTAMRTAPRTPCLPRLSKTYNLFIQKMLQHTFERTGVDLQFPAQFPGRHPSSGILKFTHNLTQHRQTPRVQPKPRSSPPWKTSTATPHASTNWPITLTHIHLAPSS